MSITKLIIAIVLFTLFVVGCDDTIEPVPPMEYDTLIPLAIGNYWLYQGYYLNSDDGSVKFPQDNKFGFIIDDTLSLIIDGHKTLNYKLFNCDESLQPYYDKPGSFEGSKLIYQERKGFYYFRYRKI